MNAQESIISGNSLHFNAVPSFDNYLQPTPEKDSLPKAPSTEIEIEYSLERALLDSLSAILRKSQGLEYDPDSLWFDSDSLWFDSDTLRFYSDSLGWENALDSLGRILSDTLNLQLSDSLSVDTIPQEELVPKEPELSPLHRYIRDYDIFKDRVYPKPPMELPEDTVLDYPKMSPLFMPLVFSARKREFKLEWREPKRQVIPESWLQTQELGQSIGIPYVKRLARQILLAFEVEQIDKIRYLNTDLPEPERLEVPLEANRPIQWSAPQRVLPRSIEEPPTAPVRYTHWVVKGRLSNQLTQTYVSPNWSSGGVSNMSTLSAFYWVAKYDNKKGIQFDNFIDIKLGFNTVSNDSLRKVNISNDQFQASSKLGIRAIKNFYYSASVDFTTQFLNNYKPNTYDMKAAFLSPAKLYLGLGMDYKIKNKEKGYSFSALLTPFTYRLNYLQNITAFNPKAFGIEEGKHFGQDMGFKIATTIDMQITEFISWNSYFYFYSDFKYIDSEWKNTFNFNVNHYLSTQLFIHMKMNTKNERPEGEKLIQFKEFLSFGLVYYW
ncbi:MAG: DUF3078 domain-containing protein [Bacteroidales bacterium]|jgi:hypothetical protein|nr:DUF3078 domain-containing protein [Bacteroidales bacterium]MDI9545060.1 DUF3078 domain-containing protein [Bacteroidota bacterium]MBP8982293.1 DUF3078 domain-containing protein [Bacteroidales bacterium]NLV38213.1 DUF3078 domain-containing protein [Bacteroidales bacterium]HNZ81513.1 DUF3078 domain-containing protein [Bacteroidales bacterium]